VARSRIPSGARGSGKIIHYKPVMQNTNYLRRFFGAIPRFYGWLLETHAGACFIIATLMLDYAFRDFKSGVEVSAWIELVGAAVWLFDSYLIHKRITNNKRFMNYKE
jgi:hypothetical protein